MAAYDPKRPRPSASTPTDDPAPVEALLDPATPAPTESPEARVEPADAAGSADAAGPTESDAAPDAVAPDAVAPEGTSPEVTVPDAAPVETEPDPTPGIALNGSSGTAPRTSSEVPVAPAPRTGTANRAVLIAAAVSSVVALLVIVLLARRRRQD